MRATVNLALYFLVSFNVLPSEFDTGLYLTFGKWWNINSKPKSLVHEVDFNLAQMKGSKQAINVIVLISIEVLFIEKRMHDSLNLADITSSNWGLFQCNHVHKNIRI